VGVGAPNVVGTSRVTFADNNLVGNTFGIIIEGAFVGNGARRGDIEVTTSGNTISQSCQNDVLLSFSNSQTALGLASSTTLLNSTYNITLGGDIPWANVWYSHAPSFGNTLVVNGQPVANGSVIAYDATRTCI
jgi:hypothetical protein